jgi:hypothetical protein
MTPLWEEHTMTSLEQYRLLGRSGLRVSRGWARTFAQAEDNLGALDVALSDEHRARLDAASAPEPIFPARFIARPLVQQLIFGGANVARLFPGAGR